MKNTKAELGFDLRSAAEDFLARATTIRDCAAAESHKLTPEEVKKIQRLLDARDEILALPAPSRVMAESPLAGRWSSEHDSRRAGRASERSAPGGEDGSGGGGGASAFDRLFPKVNATMG